MAYDYSENILVQESAGQVLEELDWRVEYAFNTEVLGEDGTFGRKNYREILLTRHFKAALRRLNPWISPQQVREAVDIMTAFLPTASLLQINEEKYRLIRDGIPVTDHSPDSEQGKRTARLIDFEKPESPNNEFLAIKELKIHGSLYRRRTDIVGFVNGIPLLFVELKRSDVDVKEAYDNNYTDYQDTIPHLFHFKAFLMLSNGLEAKIGTLGSDYEFFHEWKRLKEEDPGNVELETMLRGVCNKRNFIDLLENFILYDHSDGRTVKILSRNHQFLGVNQAIEVYRQRKLRDGKLGVFWHTQGSGKSYSMLFFAQKINRKFVGSPTFVVLTDREELNTQISELFAACGLLKGKSKDAIATSGENLITRLQGNPSYIFSLIHKFNKPDAEPIYPDHDIILMSDEAHRTQNGIYAENMMRLLPTAHRIGFTGTPLLANDNITERTFGGYISIYDFKRAVDDKATVPLFYENRGEKLKELTNPAINEQIIDAIEAADLDPSQQEKVEREFAKEIHVLTSEKRLRMIARDFVEHYSDLWTSGKAMMVCLNKVTCVRMYNYVQEYWIEAIHALESEIAHASQQEALELQRKLDWMLQTEMAVVISQEQNEIQTFAKWGLDILPHREKMEKLDLDKRFKNRENPLRIVFVCAMWLTGFDVKSLSCLYIDKPLKAHTLMQTIARANRVCEGKPNGLIIDYIGIVKALREALADYTQTSGGRSGSEPTTPKEEILRIFYETIASANDFLAGKGFILQDLIDAEGFHKQALLKDAADLMLESLETKKAFSTFATTLVRLGKFMTHEDLTEEARKQRDAIVAIHHQLQARRKRANITDLSVQINEIISEHIGTVPNEKLTGTRQFDISKIDFDLLRREFANSKHKNTLLKDIEELIKERIAQMMEANPSRINFYEEYQRIIKEYNQEQNRASIEQTFMDLMRLSQSLDSEEKRYIAEGFSTDEELSLYDLLFKSDLSKAEIASLKKFSVELLETVKAKIAELHNWREKEEPRNAIDILIRDSLWQGMPESYSDSQLNEYRRRVFEYFYERYPIVA